jgi:hypothetical protein
MIRKSILQFKAAGPRAALSKLLGAALVSAAMIAPAQADPFTHTITFEGASGLAGSTDSIQQAGFNLGFYSILPDSDGSLVGMFADGTDTASCLGGACPVNNPSTYYGALDDSLVDLMASDGNLFRIKSFDASFIGGSPVLSSYPLTAGLLRIQGFFADGSWVTETYALNGPDSDGFKFGTYNTSAAFGSNLFTEAYIFGFRCGTSSCSAFTDNRGQFAIDNLTLSVPEPSSTAMLGLGLLAMICCVRRRKA